MSKIAVAVLVVTVVVVASWVIFKNAKESVAPVLTLPILSPTPSEEQNRGSSISQPSPLGSGEIGTTQQVNTVTYTDSGYSPATITIKKGQTVTWKNNGSREMWTASAIHPTHSVYPTSGGCIGSTFDACAGVASGGTWSFKFDIAGTWKYHDHLNSSHYGTIVVE